MKKEVKMLLEKAIESLILSIELFNRPQEQCRQTGALILLDHSFEMILKAAIVHRNGKIRDKNNKNTIGFDACLRIAVSNGNIKFLTEEQALVAQAINGLRDAAQHYILQISEQQLYVHMQSGVTLFSDILSNVFNIKLSERLPQRVLPIATLAPLDIDALFRFETREIKKLLTPGSRKGQEAYSKIRPLCILDAVISGEKNTQPSDKEIRTIANKLRDGIGWNEIFKGVAGIQLSKEGTGPSISLKIAKKADVEVTLVKDSPNATVVAVKRVNELDYYSLGLKAMTGNIQKRFPYITTKKLLIVINHLHIQDNSEFYKEIRLNSQIHKRYSQNAQNYLLEQIPLLDVEHNWRNL
ncbi:hypothetical protein NW211_06610 [Barnesiella sp. ET7]|uniref:DUF3644 domain-containing protein n=1 Tax=Barnesiella sp. ET7 TaxID=2972460 RepID=UPI0021ABC053|nr:DUF3644 domain-containing protein [Barnesiella sp. ET7]MCR8911669.1 hypothetical protein [Barnesiella sp. ET7]